MKFGNITYSSVEILQEITTILKSGFDFVEINIEWPEGSVDELRKNKKAIVDLVGQFDSPPIAHTAWWMDFSSLYELERMVWVAEAKKCIDVARELGIELLNFHSHSMYMSSHRQYKLQALNNFVSSLKEITKYAGNSGITVMIENTPGAREISTLEDYSYVLNKLPQAKVHLDVGHAFIQGGMKPVTSFIKTFNKRITHLHFSDNHGQFDEHLPIGKGDIDYQSVIKMLKKINYNKTVTLEVFAPPDFRKHAVKSMKKIKTMWH